MNKAPAFQFYANDFMDLTRLWDANAVGLHVRCMCVAWTHGSIPTEQKVIARAIHCDLAELQACWPTLSVHWEDNGNGGLVFAPQEAVRQQQSDLRAKRQAAAERRWGNANADANANAKVHAKSNAKRKQRKYEVEVEVEDRSIEEEVEEEKKTRERKIHEPTLWPTFEDFWTGYEKKGNRQQAEAQWARLKQSDREAVMDRLPDYIATKPEKVYRPDGQRFLKHRTWEDELIAPPATAPKHQTNDEYLRASAEAAARKYATDYHR